MNIPVPSQNKRFKITLGVRVFEPTDLGICSYDPDRINTDFIRRRAEFPERLFKNKRSVYREFTLPFPVSPDRMNVRVYDKAYRDDHSFAIEKFKVEAMSPAEVWAEPEMHRFIDFAQNFALKAGHSPTGAYDSHDGEFLIQYLPVIEDQMGLPMITPARTNRLSGRIQVSQAAFIGYTIPVRMVVLFHERYHFQIPTRLEKPADLHAIRLYLDLGYPRTEAVYATSKIFLAHPETVGAVHAQRVQDVKQFIDDYSEKHQLKTSA